MLKRQASAALLEQSDDRLRQARELTERCNNLPMWEVTGFIHAYEHAEINFGLRMLFGEEANYGFVISAAHPTTSYSNNMGHDFDCQKTLMLSDNIQKMEGVEKIIPSFVRFQRFDDSSFHGGHGLYKFRPFKSISNGEVSLVTVSLAVAVGERHSQNVEATSDSVDVGSSLDLERERETRFFLRYHNIVRNLRWLLFERYVSVLIEPAIESAFEGWQLGFGPIDRCFD